MGTLEAGLQERVRDRDTRSCPGDRSGSGLTQPSPGRLSEDRGAGPEQGLALGSTMLIREVS